MRDIGLSYRALLRKLVAVVTIASILLWGEGICKVSAEVKTEPIQQANENAPVVFMQFYDWFHEKSWQEDTFMDKIDWAALGIYDEERDSEDFYYRMLSFIRDLGVDAISWEFHPRLGVESLYPSENAIRALERSGLKIACFYDFEVAQKVRNDEELVATLSQGGSIQATQEVIDDILSDLGDFYAHIPRESLAYDKDGKQVIYVYGYDFDDSVLDIDAWNHFGSSLIEGASNLAGAECRFYWTSKNSIFEEYLFQHYADNFVPFQFVLDTPQSQFSNKSVTWNLGYDNLGVLKRDNLQRVIRLDERYVREMGWLSGATDPAAVFIYSWNEPFEGSMAIPSEDWGQTKASLVRQFIGRLKSGQDQPLKKTALLVDDFAGYIGADDEWHYAMEREMLWYEMRRLIPQSEVYIAGNVTGDILADYDCVVDLSFCKDAGTDSILKTMKDDLQIISFDPRAGFAPSEFTDLFLTNRQYVSVNDEVAISDGVQADKLKCLADNRLFVRDDVVNADLVGDSEALMTVEIGEMTLPVVVRNGDDLWVSSYANDEDVLKAVFEAFYGMDLGISIMYGEGLSSQRLEVNPETGEITENTLNRYSINQYWAIPDDIEWRVMPREIDESYYDFVFGIE